jgi:hypothetical protein
VSIQQSKAFKTGAQVNFKFVLAQHIRYTQLMISLIEYLNCGKVYSQQDLVKFVVTKLSEIINIIIPFFNKYPLQGNKRLDYLDFCKVVALMKDKAHLTVSGLAQIKKIKSAMNTGRKHE